MKNLLLCIVLFALMVILFFSCKSEKQETITLTKSQFMLAYRCAYGRGELAGLLRLKDQWSNRDSAIAVNIYFGK